MLRGFLFIFFKIWELITNTPSQIVLLVFNVYGRLTNQTQQVEANIGRFKKSFEVLEKLTSGKFGNPHRVREIKPPKNVFVVKTITKIESDSTIQETRRLTSLIHVNVVKYFDCWIEGTGDDSILYIQMASYDDSLSTWLWNREPAKVNEAPIYEWMKQLADAMKYCHKKSVTHADLKPGNIFVYLNRLSGQHALVVGDFGVSDGTPFYSSPEQLEVALKIQQQFTKRVKLTDSIEKRQDIWTEILKQERQKILNEQVTDVFTMGLIFAEILVSRVKKWFDSDGKEFTKLTSEEQKPFKTQRNKELKKLFEAIRWNREDSSLVEVDAVEDQDFLGAASSILRNRKVPVNNTERQTENDRILGQLIVDLDTSSIELPVEKLDQQSEDDAFLADIIAGMATPSKEHPVEKIEQQSEDDAFLADIIGGLPPCSSEESIKQSKTEPVVSKKKKEFLDEYIDCIPEKKLRQLIQNMTHRDTQRRLRFGKVLEEIKSFI